MFNPDLLVSGELNSYGLTDGFFNASKMCDYGGSSVEAIQSIGYEQPFVKQGVIGKKARKALVFNGSNTQDFIINNASSLTNGAKYLTLYMVAKVTTGGTQQIPIYISTGTSAGASRADLRSLSSNVWQASGRPLDSDSLYTVGGGASSNSAHKIVTGTFDINNSNAFLYENGVQMGSNTSFGTTTSFSATDSLTIRLGSANGLNCFTGEMGIVVVYVGFHTSKQVKQQADFLNEHYNIF